MNKPYLNMNMNMNGNGPPQFKQNVCRSAEHAMGVEHYVKKNKT